MQLFHFSIKSDRIENKSYTNENGWFFKVKRWHRFVLVKVISPWKGEVAHDGKNEGNVYYSKKTVLCFGFINRKSELNGIAMFNLLERVIICSLIFAGVFINSGPLPTACLISLIAYLIISFIEHSKEKEMLSIVDRLLYDNTSGL